MFGHATLQVKEYWTELWIIVLSTAGDMRLKINWRQMGKIVLELSLVHEFTCFNVKRAVNRMSLPSRLYNGCGLSRMMKTMSAGILPCVWSPSFWNVTRVPDFQPGLMAIFTNLSSFFGVPSGCMTRREIFIFLTQPLLISSSVAYKSCSMGGSWVFSFCLCGVCTLNECDLMEDSPKKNHFR